MKTYPFGAANINKLSLSRSSGNLAKAVGLWQLRNRREWSQLLHDTNENAERHTGGYP